MRRPACLEHAAAACARSTEISMRRVMHREVMHWAVGAQEPPGTEARRTVFPISRDSDWSRSGIKPSNPKTIKCGFMGESRKQKWYLKICIPIGLRKTKSGIEIPLFWPGVARSNVTKPNPLTLLPGRAPLFPREGPTVGFPPYASQLVGALSRSSLRSHRRRLCD